MFLLYCKLWPRRSSRSAAFAAHFEIIGDYKPTINNRRDDRRRCDAEPKQFARQLAPRGGISQRCKTLFDRSLWRPQTTAAHILAPCIATTRRSSRETSVDARRPFGAKTAADCALNCDANRRLLATLIAAEAHFVLCNAAQRSRASIETPFQRSPLPSATIAMLDNKPHQTSD